jgi:hypothetical protein
MMMMIIITVRSIIIIIEISRSVTQDGPETPSGNVKRRQGWSIKMSSGGGD